MPALFTIRGLNRFMKYSKLLVAVTLALVSMVSVAQETYRLNPGDVLRVSVWNEAALQQEVLVLPDGTISFPLVGIVGAANRTPEQVQEEIKKKLSRLIPDPEINLTVSGVGGNNIFIIGKVGRQGRFPMTRPTDVVQALSLAGGLNAYASSEDILIFRRIGKKQKIINFDYSKITEGKALETNILLRSGDTIVVP